MVRIGTALLLILSMHATAFAMDILAYYEVVPADSPPVLDGKLDDPCWKAAPVESNYYKYFTMKPIPGALETRFQMVYTKDGIYLGIVNIMEDMADLRANITAHDDGNLWHDDCAEIYFDPFGKAIGFVKFTVNPLGTRHDLKRIDAAITLNNWSGNNWRVTTSKREDAWLIEAFFPWTDLGKEARPGDIWRFDHIRYSRPKGRFQGISWSLGGSYTSPENFGFLRFAADSSASSADVPRNLMRYAAPPWLLLLDGKIVSCSENRKIVSQSPDEFVAATRKQFAVSESRLRKLGVFDNPASLADKQRGPSLEEMEELASRIKTLDQSVTTPAAALQVGSELQELCRLADNIYWAIRVRQTIKNVLASQLTKQGDNQ